MKKLVLLGAAALTWAVIMIALIQYAAFAPVPPKADYHKMRIEPHLIEVVVTQTVEVKAEPYYSDIASNITAEEIDLLAKITYLVHYVSLKIGYNEDKNALIRILLT